MGEVVDIAIEAVQRLFFDKKQNHLKESLLDISLFYIYYYNKMYIKEK